MRKKEISRQHSINYHTLMSGDFARLENNTRYATFVVGDANDGARNVGRFNACTPAGMFNVRTTSNAINDNS